MKVINTQQFEDDLTRIEDHIFNSTQNITLIEKFLIEVDSVVLWIKSNVTVPRVESTGDRFWPFYMDTKGELRYRLNYLYVNDSETLILKRVLDNREQNLEIYPSHKLTNYSGDEI